MIPHLNKLLTRWPLVAVTVSIAMLAIAHGFERFANLPPCALCLHQREAYWAAIGAGLIGILAARFQQGHMIARAIALLLAVSFGAGALVAGFHVGVEFKWWPGLPECAGAGAFQSGGDLLGALSKSMDVPSCTDVPWAFLGISMAGWNMLISLGLMGASILALFFPAGLAHGGGHD